MGTKLGLHVAAMGSRFGYGPVCNEAPAVVISVGDGSPLREAAEKSNGRTITIFREQTVFHDAPPGIPQMSEVEARETADKWWGPLRSKYADNPADYYQPTNELGSKDPISLRNLIAFEMRLMELAEAEPNGIKLAIGSPAGGSPESFEMWQEFYVPLIRRAGEGGHIYSRHAYGGMLTAAGPTPTDGNAGRPFLEATFLRQAGIYTPMVITEAGQNAGFEFPGVDLFMEDMARYDQLCQQHENIWGFCCWTYGHYDNPSGKSPNIQDASERLAEYLRGQGGAVRPEYPHPVFRPAKGGQPSNTPLPSPPSQPQTGTVSGFLWHEGIEKQGNVGRVVHFLNLRAGPSKDDARLGSVLSGTVVSITGEKVGTGYYPVNVAKSDVGV
jgi:hypothetical protein